MAYLTPGLAGASLIVSILAFIFAVRRPRVDQRFDGARLAADALTAVLQSLKSVMWSAATTPPDPSIVRGVTYAADLACQAHRSRLPRGMGSPRPEHQGSGRQLLWWRLHLLARSTYRSDPVASARLLLVG
jgi:hypothetical protein